MTQEIEHINKDICNQIINVMQKEMQRLLKGYNLNIVRKRATYSDTNIQAKFEISLVNKQGKVLDRKVSDFPLYAYKYGLEADDLDRTFKFKNKNFKITGINTRSYKYPICAISMDNNKTFKFAADTVRMALHGKKKYKIKPYA